MDNRSIWQRSAGIEVRTLDNKKIKAVLFDLGETLITYGHIKTTSAIYKAGKRSYEYLKKMNQPVGRFASYISGNLLNIRVKAILAEIIGRDFDSLEELKKHGERKKFTLTDEQWHEFNWYWYEPLTEHATIEPGLPGALEAMRSAGIKLGIISNTFVNCSALDRHLKELGIIDFFPMRLYSYQYKCRKPNKHIFLKAAENIDVPPENVMYVGDRIDKDIKGSMRAGMTPVLKKAHTNDGKTFPKDVAVIKTISELPGLIERINSNGDGQ
jgi:HAD superfamily hydrolase (TIGR01662 family)